MQTSPINLKSMKKFLSVWSAMLLLSLLSSSACSESRENPNPGHPDEYIFYDKPFDRVPTIDNMRIYEAAPRVFAKSNSLQAIRTRLNAIQKLHVNVLWIMPVFAMSSQQTGGRAPFGSPYCIRDFYALDPEFGKVEDLRALVEEAHERGIAVILDLVTNHTGWDHRWVTEHPEWYARRNGEMYSPDSGSTTYTNSVQLDWTNRELYQEFIRVMKYWIAVANIDGYRCDSADWIPVDFWEEAIRALRNFQPGRQVIMLAEGTSVERLGAGFDLNYGWRFCDTLEALFAGTASVEELLAADSYEWQSIATTGKSKMRFSTNHDRTASASPVERYGSVDGSIAAFTIAALMGGVPMIYSSQEIGYAQRISIFKNDAVVMEWNSGTETAERFARIMEIASEETFRKGETRPLDLPNVVGFERRYGTDEVLVLANPSSEPAAPEIPEDWAEARCQDLLKQEEFSGSLTQIEGYGVRVLRRL